MPSSSNKKEKKQHKKSPVKKEQQSSQSHPESLGLGTPVDFLYKTMIERDPRKRKVKPVDHKNFESFDLLEDTSSDDSDYKPKNEKLDPDDDDDDVDLEEDDEENERGDKDSDSDSSRDEDFDPTSSAQRQTNGQVKSEKKSAIQSESGSLFQIPISSAADLQSASNKFNAIHVCAVCCGDQSQDADEIVECDSCCITVHENCYGITANEVDSDSVHSSLSSCSTEPWFCDVCKAGVKDVACDLCPNAGGIFKQTDAGRWVHVVCALYTTGVAFSDTIHLTGITLFELPPERWGAKACSICEDERFARTGVTISCDAGLCKTYFHVTCAQREGLLQEVQDLSQEADAIDPFIAHCKLHASDKQAVKAKKRNVLSLQSRMRFKRGSQASPTTRTNKKLQLARQRWLTQRLGSDRKRHQHQRKVPRMLTTSPAAVRILMKKADLMGFSNMNHSLNQEVLDIRKKWHVAPAFSVEFVSYYIDRGIRIANMRSKLQELQSQEASLKREEAEVMKIMTDVMPKYDAAKKSSLDLRDKARTMWSKLIHIGEDDSVHLPKVFESPVKDNRRGSTSLTNNNKSHGRRGGGAKTSPVKTSLSQELDWKECGSCKKNADQHLLALCDSCKLHFHLYCLDPPLTRMPKKTRFGGWQCSDCTDKQKKQQYEPDLDVEHEDEDDQNEESSARKRTRRGPDKYVPDADKYRESSASAGVNPSPKRRGRPPMTEKRKKMKLIAKQRALNRQKVKVEVSLADDAGNVSNDSGPVIKLEPLTHKAINSAFKKEKECCKCNQISSVKQLVQ